MKSVLSLLSLAFLTVPAVAQTDLTCISIDNATSAAITHGGKSLGMRAAEFTNHSLIYFEMPDGTVIAYLVIDACVDATTSIKLGPYVEGQSL